MFKKIFALLGAMALSFCLVACQGKTEEEKEPSISLNPSAPAVTSTTETIPTGGYVDENGAIVLPEDTFE